MKNILIYLSSTLLLIGLISSCSTEYETSRITGWDYNNSKNGGFQKVPYAEQETGPGLILIEGGSFTMGRVEQDVTYENHNELQFLWAGGFSALYLKYLRTLHIFLCNVS